MSTHHDLNPARSEIEPVHHSEKNMIEHVDATKEEANTKADAMEAENAEHAMTMTEAFRAYPMACLWAFIMSSTIVRETRETSLTSDHGGLLRLPYG